MKRINTAVQLLRIPHWIKNGFVFAPVMFAGKLGDIPVLLRVLAAFAVFCACSSAVYIFNDVLDRNSDRNHPEKSKRPVASGQVPLPTACAVSCILALAAAGGALCISVSFFTVAALYIGVNILYSLWLKHAVIIDIFCIAFGFVLRVLGGGYAAGVEHSSWILICTILLALFLGFSKRRNELTVLGADSENHRKILAEYSIGFLDQMISIVTACTVISYMLYTVSEETVAKFGTRNLIFTSVFVLYGIFRYLYLIYQKGKGGSPTRIMLTDIPLMINVLLWAVVSALIVHIYT